MSPGNEANDAPVTLLMVEFLTWLANRRRTYDEAADAWRSTCPRHTVWEDAFIEGFIHVVGADSADRCELALTPRGQAILAEMKNGGPLRL
jgi:hypothetical protein